MGPNGQKWPRHIISVHLLLLLLLCGRQEEHVAFSSLWCGAKWKCYSNALALLNYAFYIKCVRCTLRVWPCGCVPKIIKFIARKFTEMLWVLLCIEPERNGSKFHSTISKCSGEFESDVGPHVHNPHAAVRVPPHGCATNSWMANSYRNRQHLMAVEHFGAIFFLLNFCFFFIIFFACPNEQSVQKKTNIFYYLRRWKNMCMGNGLRVLFLSPRFAPSINSATSERAVEFGFKVMAV